MDTMTSTEFRRRYATITEATEVTVNGHGIGQWLPYPPAVVIPDPTHMFKAGAQAMQDGLDAAGISDVRVAGTTFNSRPFTPVPKR